MAGSIHITEDISWSVGSVAFVNVVERTRHLLNPVEQTAIEEAYLPMEQGFDFIALDELDKSAFCIFHRNCKKAFEEYRATKASGELPKNLFEGVMDCWTELLEMLSHDERSEPDQ